MSEDLSAELADLESRSETARLGAIDRLRSRGSLAAAGAIAGRLGDASIAVRRAASESLAAHPSDEVGSLLVQLLRRNHLDPLILGGVVAALVRTPLPVTDAVAGLLGAEEASLRIQAALILGLRGDACAVPALEAALDDTDHNVRVHAIEALGQLASRSSLRLLLARAEQEDLALAFAAVTAIGEIGDGSAARRLERMLGRPELAFALVPALGRTGDAASIAPLTAALHRPGMPRGAVLSAVAAIARRHPDADGELRARIGEPEIRVIAHHAAEASAGELSDIVDLLRRLDGPIVVDALSAAVARAVCLDSRDDAGTPERALQPMDVAIAAIGALGRTRSSRALKPITALLVDRHDALVVPLIEALGAITSATAADPSAADPAVADAVWSRLDDADAAAREAAIHALRAIGGIDRARIRALLGATDPVLRRAGVCLLPVDAEGCAAVLTACRDDDACVRRAAVSRLPEIGSGNGLDALDRALGDADAKVRVAAAEALGRVEATAVHVGLARALHDGDAWVRYQAVRSLRHSRSGLEPRLIELAADDAAPFVRIAAIEALAQCPSRAAHAALRAITGADLPEIAAVASRALASMQGGER